MDIQAMELEELEAFAAKLSAERDKAKAQDRLGHYKPYGKQMEFHNANVEPVYERLFMAGNQLGKTFAGAAELAMHLTGRYPAWYTGRRFDRPITALAGSESSELTRDGVQRLLMGPPANEEEWGTGYIPKDAILDRTRKSGVPNALDSVTVRHVNGGASTVLFKSYDQGRSKWQANTVDVVWFDEEPPADVYSEGKTRTNATRGIVYLTFTPLLGMSEVVRRFLMEHSPYRQVITMTIMDVEHYTPEEVERIVASYPEHERDARTKGIPIMGSGRVFSLDEAQIIVPAFTIPDHWPRIGGLDFGWDHPTGAVELAWNKDHDIVYLIREHRQSKATPTQHAAILNSWHRRGKIRWAWPHDGLQHDKGSGEQLAKQYRAAGLDMLAERATFPDGSNGTEAGVQEMLQRMLSGKWKVFDGACPLWLEEFRLYHRKDGKIVKIMDDLLSASRYAMMMLRHARVVRSATDRYGFADQKPEARVAQGVGEVDF